MRDRTKLWIWVLRPSPNTVVKEQLIVGSKFVTTSFSTLIIRMQEFGELSVNKEVHIIMNFSISIGLRSPSLAADFKFLKVFLDNNINLARVVLNRTPR